MDSKVVWTDYPCLFPETIPKPSRSFANCLEEKKRTPSHRAAGPDKDKATGASHKAKRFCVSVFQRFNQKKACPTTPSSLSAHTLILPFTLITKTNCYNILYITYYILYIIINNTTIGERKGKTTPRLYLHWNAETLKHFEQTNLTKH